MGQLDCACVQDGVAYLLTDGATKIDAHTISTEPSAGGTARSDWDNTVVSSENKRNRQKYFPDDVLWKGLSIAIEKAAANSDVDRQRILNHIAGRDVTAEPLDEHDS